VILVIDNVDLEIIYKIQSPFKDKYLLFYLNNRQVTNKDKNLEISSFKVSSEIEKNGKEHYTGTVRFLVPIKDLKRTQFAPWSKRGLIYISEIQYKYLFSTFKIKGKELKRYFYKNGSISTFKRTGEQSAVKFLHRYPRLISKNNLSEACERIYKKNKTKIYDIGLLVFTIIAFRQIIYILLRYLLSALRIDILYKKYALHLASLKKLTGYYKSSISLFLFLSIVFCTIKTFKYNTLLIYYNSWVRRRTPQQLKDITFFEQVSEYLYMQASEIMLAFIIAFLFYLTITLIKQNAKNICKVIYLFVSILLVTLAIADCQVYEMFNVPLNLELIKLFFTWPDVLLSDTSAVKLDEGNSLIYISILAGSLIVLPFIFFSKLAGVSTNIIYILLIVTGINFFSKQRPIDNLGNTFADNITEDIFVSLFDFDAGTKYIKEHKQKNNFKKLTDLKKLNPKTNIVLIVYESTSEKYVSDYEHRKKIVPNTLKFIKSDRSIHVKNYHTPVPHTSTAMATIFTGSYVRMDRPYANNAFSKKPTLISTLKNMGYKSYLVRTSDLLFENQKSYYSNLGLEVYDREWFRKKNPPRRKRSPVQVLFEYNCIPGLFNGQNN